MDFYLGQNDQLPEITATLDTNPVTEFSLSGATVRFNYRNNDTGVATVGVAVIVDAATRKVKFAFPSGGAAVAGNYMGRWKVTFSDNKAMQFPNDRYLDFRITAEV